jgi:hypothetical protein
LKSKQLLTVTKFYYSQENVIDETKKFVAGIISKSGAGICPYTADSERAGTPVMGLIKYSISIANTKMDAITDYWEHVKLLTVSDDREMSTVLLIFPECHDFNNFDDFETFSNDLDDMIKNRDDIDNVYFHPEFKFRDGDGQIFAVFDDNGDIIGMSDEFPTPISYARRSPYPIINILKSPMVKAAQKFVPEGKVVYQNTQKLDSIGLQNLHNMLINRNWDTLIQE